MGCFDRYITIDSSTPSRSGLYAVDLPGVDILLLDSVTKTEQPDYKACYESIYKRACQNLVSDIEKMLQSKFFVDKKLISRETSEFNESYHESGGIRIRVGLPKYARIHIVSIDIKTLDPIGSPEPSIWIEDKNGVVIYEVPTDGIVEGFNTIFIDKDFELDDLTIRFEGVVAYQTDNKYYPDYTYYDEKFYCQFDCADNLYPGRVDQLDGGGLNVKFNVLCSVEKYVCENINIFKQSLYWRLGLETCVERRFGNRFNQFTTMTTEDAQNLQDFYNSQYQTELQNSVKSTNMREDPICFNCKSLVSSKTILP